METVVPQPETTLTEAEIEALVRRFYGKARLDPALGPVFEAAVEDWEDHFARLTAFWSSVLLATRRYQGRPMQAHARHPIRPEMFDRWLEIWGETADELFAPDIAERLRARAAMIGKSLSLGLFFRPDAAEG